MAIILDSITDIPEHIYTDREIALIHRLRVLLKDIPFSDTFRSLNTLVEQQRGERWDNFQLLSYLNQAASDINSEPPHTLFMLENFPEQWDACLMNGALIFALIGNLLPHY